MKAAWLLRWYPKAWRERYGEELLALIQDTADDGRAAWRLWLGVAWGGLRERGHQAARAGRAAVKRRDWVGRWVTFLWTGLIAACITPGLTAPHHPASGWQAEAAFDGVLAVSALTGVVVLAVGLTALPALVSFVRAGGWPKIRRRVGWAAGATVAAGGGLAGLVVVGSHPNAPAGVAFVATFVAAGLAVGAMIGLWAAAAAAAARHLTLAPRARSVQLMLGAVLPSASPIVFAALALWWAATETPAWLFVVLAQLGGACVTTWRQLRAAARKERGLRAAVRGARAEYPGQKIAVTMDSPIVMRVTAAGPGIPPAGTGPQMNPLQSRLSPSGSGRSPAQAP